MYTNYLASAEEQEGEGTQPTGNFLTSDILASAKKYERKMGKTNTKMAAVRLGARSSQGVLQPKRFTPSRADCPGGGLPGQSSTGGSADFRARLQTIEDEEELGGRGTNETRDRGNNSSISTLLDSLRMSPNKTSPDSGSFSMTTTGAMSLDLGQDFTESLLQNRSNTTTATGGAVRMTMKTRPPAPPPVRMALKEQKENWGTGQEVFRREQKEGWGTGQEVFRREQKEGWGGGQEVFRREQKENWGSGQEVFRREQGREREVGPTVGEPRRMSSVRGEGGVSSQVFRPREGEEQGGVKEEQGSCQGGSVGERLQHLSGSGSGQPHHPAPLRPTPPSIPAPRDARTLLQTPLPHTAHTHHAHPAPTQHALPHTALAHLQSSSARSLLTTPAPRPAQPRLCTPAPQQQQPREVQATPSAKTPAPQAMPPPSMSLSQAREQVLVVRGKRYRVMKLLGKGGSSRVYEAFDEQRNSVVAIKRVNLEEADEATTAGYINEIAMLEKLQGEDRIVRLFDHETVEAEDVLYVVMEKGDTDLSSLLKKYASKEEMTPAMIKHYWKEMLHAVSVIHRNGIIHKDLKPANFLLVAGRLKLIDFGIASSVQSDKTSVMIDNQMGTFNFMSPESIQDLNGPQYSSSGHQKPCIKISFKTDVWSLGCILYNLTYGKMPFGDIKHALMKLQAITNVNHVIPFPPLPNEDEVLVSLIKSCLVRDPAGRPSIQALLVHPYVTGVEARTPSPSPAPPSDPLQQLRALAAAGVLSPGTFARATAKVRSSSDLG